VELIVTILKKVPEGWPRLLTVIAILLLIAAPQVRELLFGRKLEERKLDRAQKLLAVRKLQLDVEKLKNGEPQTSEGGSQLDAQVEALLRQDAEDHAPKSRPLFRARFVNAILGGLGFFALCTIFVVLGGLRDFESTGAMLWFLLSELLGVTAVAALVAIVPTESARTSMLYGFGLPLLIGSVIALLR
jgi:hypothetical protein